MRPHFYLYLVSVLVSTGCNAILGLDEFTAESSAIDGVGEMADAGAGTRCTTNRECTDRATLAWRSSTADDDAGADAAIVPAVCLRSAQRCAPLLSAHCTTVTGDYLNDRAIVIGSLFSTTGAQATTNIARQQSAMLAVEQINAVGGIPLGNTSSAGSPLVMVSCDEAADLFAAGSHLIHNLAVPAIIGPNTSQDTLDLSKMLTIEAGTVVISPTAVASTISDLIDRGLTWLMVPSDVQRAPLMIQQINALEEQLGGEREQASVKLGVVFRDDALGIGTRVSLNALVLNGKPLSDPINLGSHVRIDGYDFKQTDQSALVQAYVDFAPDIIVVAGTAESVTSIMVPIEQRWPDERPRPYYVLIDSAKNPELLAAVTGNDDLRRRIRGTGVTPGPQSVPVYNAFKVEYGLRFPGSPTTISGMGPSYDAAYAVAYALTAMHGAPVAGGTVAQGLRKLSGGATTIELQGTKILAAFRELAAGSSIDAVGTFGPLRWDDNGAVVGGTIEMWCIGAATGAPVFESSGLTFDIASGALQGRYTQCGP